MTVILLGMIALGLHAEDSFDYFQEFCAIGERVPGTKGHRRARDYIIEHCPTPDVDSFFTRGMWFYNIYQRFPGTKARIAIAAHWDSDIGCPGANDGGSGVALLLSLADTLARDPSDQKVDLLFFDGEDVEQAELLGSKHFATQCVDEYSFIIVIDMVADADLQIFQEGNSAKFFPGLVDSIWDIGRSVAPNVFIPFVKYFIVDDHISLIQYGLRAIDIIDFDYPYWDSKDDTIDKCSRESLAAMYSFLLRIIYPFQRY
jgi:glutaminyl-peptide cyclotransferase